MLVTMNKTIANDVSATTGPTRARAVGTALTELAVTISLIVSIAVIICVAGASGVLAATRTDLIMMEESPTFTTAGIIAIIAVVMGILTLLALRDVAPAHSKRGNRRSSARRR